MLSASSAFKRVCETALIEIDTMKRIFKNKKWFSIENQRAMALYLCFVVVAALLWFINVLDKNYTYTLSVPTRYENCPLDKALLYHLPKTVDVHVNTDGITLCKHLLFSEKETLDFDLATIAQQEKTTITVKNYALLDSLLHGMTILDIQPESIIFAFQNIRSKRVKIQNALDLQFERQYQLTRPIWFIPDSVTIYGAPQVINSIFAVYTIPTTITDISNQSSHKIALQTIENVTFSDSVITVMIDAEQFTEKKYIIPITYSNVPASVVVDLMQHNVTLTMFVGMSQAGKISEADFKAIADYDKRNSATGEIPVEIIAKPQNGTIIHQNPENVEIIVEID